MVKFELFEVESNGIVISVADGHNYAIIYENCGRVVTDMFTSIGNWLMGYNMKHLSLDDLLTFTGHTPRKIDYAYPCGMDDDKNFYIRRYILNDTPMISYETSTYGDLLWRGDVEYEMRTIIKQMVESGDYTIREVGC